MIVIRCVVVLAFILCSPHVFAEIVDVGDRRFTIPDGYELKLAISPDLSQRPIVVDLDERGHLFVAESSGTNDNVQKQLADKPHSILRLSDSDGDGVYDKRTVFADRMMFPAGVLCYRGSVYVTAPPHIWKLTDTDDDGVADEREVWFDAKTLTGCANDLHGPFLGFDGWIYWCKGAFAEQTYATSQDGAMPPFVTRAAHIFRRRPEGGLIEHVMTGGMDNPVEVAFTRTGERLFTTTFFQHPANGKRDGLVHAIYGGVYGKQHGVIDDHPRTGKLMPVMTHLGAAAPSGIVRLESDSLGLRDQLLTACFNLHSVTRHELIPSGATFATEDTTLVSSEDLDFHPTDVTEDADGSVLIVDTGGWYKLCCPTSQLHKPDVPGAIYRLTKKGSLEGTRSDPFGIELDWSTLSVGELVELLGDRRPAVRRRAIDVLSTVGGAIRAIASANREGASELTRLNSVWAACRIDTPSARTFVRSRLNDEADDVRQVAAHAAGVWRDKQAIEPLIRLLEDESPHVQRAAAEAVGRVGSRRAIPKIMQLVALQNDRVLEHSLIYALIEIGSADELRNALASGRSKQNRAALLALRAIRDSGLSSREIAQCITSGDQEAVDTAATIAVEHPEWSEALAQTLRSEITKDSSQLASLSNAIGMLSGQPAIAKLVGEVLSSGDAAIRDKVVLVEATRAKDGRLDSVYEKVLDEGVPQLVSVVVRKLSQRKDVPESLLRRLFILSKSESIDAETRLLAARQLGRLDDKLFTSVQGLMALDQPARRRSLAISVLENTDLERSQLLELASSLQDVGPFELARLLRVFEKSNDETVGQKVFAALDRSAAAESLSVDQISKLAERFGDKVARMAEPLLSKLSVESAGQAERLIAIQTSLPKGDVRRGQKLFHDQKLACFACHAIGYRGGNVGPDLSRIGKTRSRRDLLEAIAFPSASFVRSYEPVNVVTTDGRQLTGIIRDESSTDLSLQVNATEVVKVSRIEVEEMLPGKVSVMPSGLDKELSAQEMADLLAFLESRQ